MFCHVNLFGNYANHSGAFVFPQLWFEKLEKARGIISRFKAISISTPKRTFQLKAETINWRWTDSHATHNCKQNYNIFSLFIRWNLSVWWVHVRQRKMYSKPMGLWSRWWLWRWIRRSKMQPNQLWSRQTIPMFREILCDSQVEMWRRTRLSWWLWWEGELNLLWLKFELHIYKSVMSLCKALIRNSLGKQIRRLCLLFALDFVSNSSSSYRKNINHSLCFPLSNLMSFIPEQKISKNMLWIVAVCLLFVCGRFEIVSWPKWIVSLLRNHIDFHMFRHKKNLRFFQFFMKSRENFFESTRPEIQLSFMTEGILFHLKCLKY